MMLLQFLDEVCIPLQEKIAVNRFITEHRRLETVRLFYG